MGYAVARLKKVSISQKEFLESFNVSFNNPDFVFSLVCLDFASAVTFPFCASSHLTNDNLPSLPVLPKVYRRLNTFESHLYRILFDIVTTGRTQR